MALTLFFDWVCRFFGLVVFLIIRTSHLLIPPQIYWIILGFNLWVSGCLISRMKTITQLVTMMALKIEALKAKTIDLGMRQLLRGIFEIETWWEWIVPMIARWIIITYFFLLFLLLLKLSIVVDQILIWILLLLFNFLLVNLEVIIVP